MSALIMFGVGPAVRSAHADAGNGPAANQYVERVPSGGDQSTAGHHAAATRLAAPVRRALREQGGSDAPALTAVATSPALGAPPAAPATRRRGHRRPTAHRGRTDSVRVGATKASGGGNGPGSGSVALLLGGLVAITGLGGGVALARRSPRQV